MTRVGLGATCNPSPDDDTCRVGCEPCVQSITAWREKKPSYKGKLKRICIGTFSLRLIVLGWVHFSTVLQSIVFSQFFGVLVTDLSVRAPPAAEAPYSVFRFSERLSVVRTWRACGVKLARKIVKRQRSCARSTGRFKDLSSTMALELLKNSKPINWDKFSKITARLPYFFRQNYTLFVFDLSFFLYFEFWSTSFFYFFITLWRTQIQNCRKFQ